MGGGGRGGAGGGEIKVPRARVVGTAVGVGKTPSHPLRRRRAVDVPSRDPR